jgi:hypothetical protein
MTIAFLLLMNMLLAILVDAYILVKVGGWLALLSSSSCRRRRRGCVRFRVLACAAAVLRSP